MSSRHIKRKKKKVNEEDVSSLSLGQQSNLLMWNRSNKWKDYKHKMSTHEKRKKKCKQGR